MKLFIQDKNCFFLINRGFETLAHCFRQLFMYTKNLELTCFHCKKAYYYYIEFIGQISDDTHSYLQLTSKMQLFFFKKTIFEIDNSVRKQIVISEKEKQFLKYANSINMINEIYINYIQKLIQIKKIHNLS